MYFQNHHKHMAVKALLLFVGILFAGFMSIAQNSFQLVELKLIDEKTSLPIKNAEITFRPVGKKTKTGTDGLVKLILPPGKTQIEINHAEYVRKGIEMDIRNDTSFVVEMETLIQSYMITDIDVTSKFNDKVSERPMGLERINLVDARKLPSILSELDIVRSIALLPGTSFSSEAATDLSVRGGMPDQNLFLFDNATLYSSANLYGLISPYQSALIDEVNFYKGYFPPRLGGRCSSVIETVSKRGFANKYSGEVNLGLINSSVYTAIPIVKDRISLYVGARYSYMHILQRLFKPSNMVEFAFSDLYVKSNFRLTDKTQGSVLFLSNTDGEKFMMDRGLFARETTQTKRKNLLAQLSAETKTDNATNLFGINYTTFNNGYFYESKSHMFDTLGTSFDSYSKISEITIKNHFEKKLGDLVYNAGLQSSAFLSSPYLATGEISGEDAFKLEMPELLGFESALYAGFYYPISDKLTSDVGVRASTYYGNNIFFIYPELRAQLQLRVNEKTSLKASFSNLTQGLHLLKNTGIGMQYDIWVPSTKDFAPERSSIVSLGFFRDITLFGMSLHTSAEVYYKSQQNIIFYRDGFDSNSFIFRNSILNGNWENAITQGKGQSWGLELSADKQVGAFKGSLSYTLAWAFHQFELLNRGDKFPSPYDRRHNVSISGSYSLPKGWDIGMSWVFASGAPITVPVAAYTDFKLDHETARPFSPDIWGQYPFLLPSDRNAYRMIPYHRLDLSVQKTYELPKNRKAILKLGVYNVYDRKNPYFYYWVNERFTETPSGQKKLYSASILPIIPSISYTYKF
jgi:hypothetical protein